MKNIVEKYYYESVKGIDQSILDNKNTWYNYVLNLPINLQVVYTVVLFHSQVENGGFHQYFFNSYGQFAYLTLNNLKLIGAQSRRGLLERALKEVNYENWNEVTFRELVYTRKLEKISSFDQELFDFLNELDDEYYALENEDIIELLTHYLENE